MKVLILGVTGFIGRPVAQAFVRNGHEVYGQTRSDSKAKSLIADEIIPVVCELADGAAWSDVAAKADVVIDCSSGTDLKAQSAALFKIASEAAAKGRGANPPKATYIFTGGIWVHGEDRENTTSERSPAKNTTTLVSWRPAFEQTVIASTKVDGIVIRPAMLYGYSGSIFSMLFSQAGPGKEIVWAGKKGGRWSVIHADDLANLYVSIAEAAPICKGLIFDGANDVSESIDDILEATARVSGSSGWRYVEPDNVFTEAIAITTILRPSLARALVGWRPLKPGVVDGIKTYYAAFKASTS